MKQLFFRLTWLAARIAAVLSTCLGCNSNNNAEPSDPHEIHWRGQDSGYEGTSTGAQSNPNSGADINIYSKNSLCCDCPLNPGVMAAFGFD